MNRQQAERRALEALDAASRNESAEDSLVELKAEWPDPFRMARRLAGQCNSARGQPVLWLIGINEAGGVTQIEAREKSSWWPQVVSQFDGVAPELDDYISSTDKGRFTILVFRTDAAPYVVKGKASGGAEGSYEREVPYRSGTGTRSAYRHELVRLLGSAPWRGDVRLFDARLELYHSREVNGYGYNFRVSLHFDHQGGGPLILPLALARVGVGPHGGIMPLATLWADALDDVGPKATSQIYIERSGAVEIGGSGLSNLSPSVYYDVPISIHLRTSDNGSAVRVTVPLMRRPKPDILAEWIAKREHRWLGAKMPVDQIPSQIEDNWYATIVSAPRMMGLL